MERKVRSGAVYIMNGSEYKLFRKLTSHGIDRATALAEVCETREYEKELEHEVPPQVLLTSQSTTDKIVTLYKEGYSIYDVAKMLKVPWVRVHLIIFELRRKGMALPRRVKM